MAKRKVWWIAKTMQIDSQELVESLRLTGSKVKSKLAVVAFEPSEMELRVESSRRFLEAMRLKNSKERSENLLRIAKDSKAHATIRTLAKAAIRVNPPALKKSGKKGCTCSSPIQTEKVTPPTELLTVGGFSDAIGLRKAKIDRIRRDLIGPRVRRP